jgi:hypothetical protein
VLKPSRGIALSLRGDGIIVLLLVSGCLGYSDGGDDGVDALTTSCLSAEGFTN